MGCARGRSDEEDVDLQSPIHSAVSKRTGLKGPENCYRTEPCSRETINTNLDKVRAFADGVLLEFGPSREQDLALRNRIRQWQPNLRILFILRIVLWRYRVRLPGFELPEAIQPAQAEFDNRLATELDRMADRWNGDESAQKDDLTSAYAQLEQATWKALPKEQHQLTPKIESFLLLSRRIATLADSLERSMHAR